MILQEALDKCTICGLFNKNVSDEHKFQAIDKIMSTPNTKVPKAKLGNIIAWLLKKVEWKDQQIEKMKCCANCKSFKGYGETCEGWGEPVLNLNCDCTEWELKEIEK